RVPPSSSIRDAVLLPRHPSRAIRGSGAFLVAKSRVPTVALFSIKEAAEVLSLSTGMEEESESVRVKDIILKRKIGNGSFSAVWRAEHRGTGEEVAVKQVFLSKLNLRLKSLFHCELNFLSSVNHPNIVRLLDFFQYDGIDQLNSRMAYTEPYLNHKLCPLSKIQPKWKVPCVFICEKYCGFRMYKVDMVVVIDGSRILGLGDWSSWKWQSIGKLDLYVAAAGKNPKR
ncbi:hypothetical protein S245_040043, partial [Arachis hypogaea]